MPRTGDNYVHDADLVISTAQVPFDVPVPVFTNAIAFLTGIGIDELVEEINGTLDGILAENGGQQTNARR